MTNYIQFPVDTLLYLQKQRIEKYVNYLKNDLAKYPRVVNFGQKNGKSGDGVITTKNQIYTKYLELGDRFYSIGRHNRKKPYFLGINLYTELEITDTRPVKWPLHRESAYVKIQSNKEKEYVKKECARYLCVNTHTGSKNLQKTTKEPECDCYWCSLL